MTSGCVIADVQVHHLRAAMVDPGVFDGSYETTVVRVTTDTGVEGIGEADSLPAAIKAIVNGPSAHSAAQALREVLVGRDPTDIAGAWAAMYDGTSYIGRRGIVIHAIGALDIALWDLRGKLEGKPACRLAGEQRHERIEVYASSYPSPDTPEALRRQLEGFRAQRLRNVKLFVEPWWLDDFERARALVTLACEIADGGKVIVDGVLAYDGVPAARRIAEMLRDAGAWLFEAPLPLDDVDGHKQLRDCGIRLGVGDLGLTHPAEWEDMLVRGHADALQPDPSCVGGITGMLEVAALADRFDCLFIPHGYKTRITLAASLHVLASRAEPPLVEYCLSASPLIRDLTLEQFPVDDEGFVAVPTAPGLGVTLNANALERYAFR